MAPDGQVRGALVELQRVFSTAGPGSGRETLGRGIVLLAQEQMSNFQCCEYYLDLRQIEIREFVVFGHGANSLGRVETHFSVISKADVSRPRSSSFRIDRNLVLNEYCGSPANVGR